MATRIIIPEPCSGDWNHMTPAGKGRHCALCAKTVVDFTMWSLTDIASYLRKHSSSHVCGRFRNSQLNVEIPYSTDEWVAQVAGSGYSFLQKLALIFLLAFGFLTSGCGSTTEGEPKVADTAVQQSPPGTTGAVAIDSPATCTQPVDTPRLMIMGEIARPMDTPNVLQGRVGPRASGTSDRVGKPVVQTMVEGPHVTAGAPMMVEEPPRPLNGPDSSAAPNTGGH